MILRMKRISLLLLLGFMMTSLLLQAQCPPPQVANEVGTHLFSFKPGGAITQGLENGYRPTLLSGLHFKHYNEVGAFRMSFGYMKAHFSQEGGADCADCLDIDGDGYGGIFKIGYERFTFLGPMEPYVALDVFASYETAQSHITGTGITGQYQDYFNEQNRTGVGLSPSIGLRFFFSYSVSLGAETSLNAGLYMNKNTQNRTLPEPEFYIREDNGFDWEWHPVSSLSLNVMF